MFSLALIAIACGFAAAVAWGLADFLAAKATRSIGPVSATIAVNVVGFVGFGVFYVLSRPAATFEPTGVMYAVLAGIALGVGQITFFQGLNIGPVSLVSPLASAYPLITTLGVVTFFQARLSPRQVLGIVAVVIGAMAASELFNLRRQDRRLGRGPMFALATAVAWGIAYVMVSQALKTLSWQSASLIQLAMIAVVCLVLGPLIAGTERLWHRHAWRVLTNRFVLTAGLIQMSGLVIINLGIGLDTNLAAIVTALSASYSALTILLALKHLNEEFKLVPLVGAGVTIAGTIVLSLG